MQSHRKRARLQQLQRQLVLREPFWAWFNWTQQQRWFPQQIATRSERGCHYRTLQESLNDLF